MGLGDLPADRIGGLMFFFILILLVLVSPGVFAQDLHQDQGEAYAHCMAVGSACEGTDPPWNGYVCEFSNGTPNDKYSNKAHWDTNPTPAYHICPGQSVSHHEFPELAECKNVQPIPLPPESWGPGDMGATYCLDGCEFEVVMWCGGGQIGFCSMFASPTGALCDGSDTTGPTTVPDGCTLTSGVMTCDCVNNPDSWFCSDYPNPDGTESDNHQRDDNREINDTGTDSDPDGNGESGDQSGGGDGGACEAGDLDGDGVNDTTGEICNGGDGGGGGGDGGDDRENTEIGMPGGTLCQGSPPTCSSQSPDCALLLQAWQQNQDIYCGTEQGDPWDIPSDVVNPFDSENQEVTDFGTQQFDTSGQGGGACPANPFLNLSSGSYEIDISAVCTFAETVRPLLISITVLLCALYVFRNV